MAENETKLKLREETDLTNSIKVVGYLKAKSIEEGKDKNDKPCIKGKLTVLTKENQSSEVDFFCPKFTKDNKVSKLFEDAQKLKEYKSIVDLLEGKVKNENGEVVKVKDEEEALNLCDVVSINGNIAPNEYFDDEDKLQSRPKLNGKFFHRVEKSKVNTDDFGVFFDVEVFFTSIKKELKDKMETGRALIEAVVPTSIEPARVGVMNFIVTDKNGASDYILDNYEKNASGNIWGEFLIVTKQEEKKSGFGSSNKASSNSVEFVWLVTGGEKRQYSESSKKAFDVNVIKEALNQRLIDLKKAKEENKDKKKSNGFGNSSSSKSSNASKQTQENIAKKFSDEDY